MPDEKVIQEAVDRFKAMDIIDQGTAVGWTTLYQVGGWSFAQIARRFECDPAEVEKAVRSFAQKIELTLRN